MAIVGVAALLGLWSLGADAQTFEAALAQAYMTNPVLEAQHAQLRATDELVPQARAGYRPVMTASGSYGFEYSDGWKPSIAGAPPSTTRTDLRPSTFALQLTQPIYHGGSIAASVAGAENKVQAQRANVMTAEEQVLLNAATAFLDVVRDQSIVDLTTSNEQVVARQLEATGSAFRIGSVTQTDVSQAESRRAGATATRIQAQGNLTISRAAFQRTVGTIPGELAAPHPALVLPASLAEAIQAAQDDNPQVTAAQYSEAASRNAIDQDLGKLLPQIDFTASVIRSNDYKLQGDRLNNAVVMAQVTFPLYDAGLVPSEVRQDREATAEDQVRIDDIKRQVARSATSAWQAVATARANIQSYHSSVAAAAIALEGVRQELRVRTRTTLDLLNAQQELLNAQVNLVTAVHDELVAQFQLLYATGALSARQLNLPVPYFDPDANERNVRDRWWGTASLP
ncbi:MAG: TolC family outer membrane protein [Azospirillaceae bacterium]|nr:TolC family outer membrane protein [Azospirillaceae bacterium]